MKLLQVGMIAIWMTGVGLVGGYYIGKQTSDKWWLVHGPTYQDYPAYNHQTIRWYANPSAFEDDAFTKGVADGKALAEKIWATKDSKPKPKPNLNNNTQTGKCNSPDDPCKMKPNVIYNKLGPWPIVVPLELARNGKSNDELIQVIKEKFPIPAWDSKLYTFTCPATYNYKTLHFPGVYLKGPKVDVSEGDLYIGTCLPF